MHHIEASVSHILQIALLTLHVGQRTTHADVLNITQSIVVQKMSDAVVSWGFHNPVCYHILIKRAPLCLHPSSNLCGALLGHTKHNYNHKITQCSSITVFISLEPSSKSLNCPFCHRLMQLSHHLRLIDPELRLRTKRCHFLQRTNNIVFPPADSK